MEISAPSPSIGCLYRGADSPEALAKLEDEDEDGDDQASDVSQIWIQNWILTTKKFGVKIGMKIGVKIGVKPWWSFDMIIDNYW